MSQQQPQMPPPMNPMYPPQLPPGMYPPPMFMPPPPPPRGGGGGFVRGIMVTLATTIFGLSLTLNLYLLIAHGIFNSNASARSSNLSDGDPGQKWPSFRSRERSWTKRPSGSRAS
jgi:hypothetical protein